MTPEQILERLQGAGQAPLAAPAVEHARASLRGKPSIPAEMLLAGLCTQMRCSFTFRGDAMSPAEVMRHDMFLPAVAWVVQDAGHRLLGGSLGCALRVDDRGLFGVVASVPTLTDRLGDFMRGLFLTHYTTHLFGMEEDLMIEVEPMYIAMQPAFERLMKTAQVSAEGEIQWQPIPPVARPA